MHTAEPLVPGPSHLEIEISIAKLKKYKSPGSDLILAELYQAQWDSTSAIHRFQESLWFSEEGSIVQHSYRVWNPHEISQAH
jgi:hypothetical protein